MKIYLRKVDEKSKGSFISGIEFCCQSISFRYQINSIIIDREYGHLIVEPESEKSKGIMERIFFNYCPFCGSKIEFIQGE